MVSCPECGKNYASQSSLNRHLNNHSVHTTGHRCSVCDQAFSRRDLMMRHRAIHEETPPVHRRRCHTACETCRNMHEKCDGGKPCNICRDRNQECVYRQKSGRVSQPARSNSDIALVGDQPLEAPTQTPNTRQEARKVGIEQDVSQRDSPWSTTDISLYPRTETRPASGQRQETTTTNAMSDGTPWDGAMIMSPGDYMTSILQSMPNSSTRAKRVSQEIHGASRWTQIENGLEAEEDSGLFADSDELHLVGIGATEMIQNDEIYASVDNSTVPEAPDMLLPDLPELPFEDQPFLLENSLGQNYGRDSIQREKTLTWGSDNLLQQLTDSNCDLFSARPDYPIPSLAQPRVMQDDDGTRPHKAQQQQRRQEGLGQIPASQCEDIMIDSDGSIEGGNRKDSRSEQHALVEKLIEYAISSSDTPYLAKRDYWESTSFEVCEVFGLSQPAESSLCILLRMVQLYRQNILSLWPMICENHVEEPLALHPVLFLVAVSIGAMYLDQRASVFGDILQKALRTTLITSSIEKEITETDTIWLAQARNTIQVVSLYSGEGFGLTYAQQLGAALVSQSRRMNLFRRVEDEDFSSARSAEEHVAAWVRAETRRRVAFGIFRADVFTSLLRNSPPSISAEELQIFLPYPDSLWQSIGRHSPEEMVTALRHESRKRSGLLFCDLVRIALDRDEVLLNMEARDYELLLFGLQKEVWKFSHDPDMFQRLTGLSPQDDGYTDSLDMDASRIFNNLVDHSKSRDHLQVGHREMKDLNLDRRRLCKALEKWSQSFNACRFRPEFNIDRGSILSCFLLFHIYHLQLNASLDVLHQIADGRCKKTTIEDRTLRKTIRWAHSKQGRKAMYHASKIWSLLDNEAKLNPTKKARYTILAYMGLYHASVVLWAAYGAQSAGVQVSAAQSISSLDRGNLIRPGDILMNIVFLYQRLKCMNWDAFADSVQTLSRFQFPRDHTS